VSLEQKGIEDMGRNIRFELVATAVLAFVPAVVANATDV
jgi:hypothetical protein